MEPATNLDWSMGSHASRLADWTTALDVGKRIAGPGPRVVPADRARMREDLAGHVVRAEGLVTDFTGLAVEGFRSRAWVMGRGDWIRQNISGLQRLMEPLAQRLLGTAARPTRSVARRSACKRARSSGTCRAGSSDSSTCSCRPTTTGLIYFVGPNMVEVERKYDLTPEGFRFWVAIHEVTHRVQFSSAAWLRGYLGGMVDEYLGVGLARVG